MKDTHKLILGLLLIAGLAAPGRHSPGHRVRPPTPTTWP